MVSAGAIVTAIGAAGTGAMIPMLVTNVDALTIALTAVFAVAILVGAGLIQRGRSARVDVSVVESVEPELENTQRGRRGRYPAEFVVGELLAPPPSSSPVAIRSLRAAVAAAAGRFARQHRRFLCSCRTMRRRSHSCPKPLSSRQ
jgi:hypothetical protein